MGQDMEEQLIIAYFLFLFHRGNFYEQRHEAKNHGPPNYLRGIFVWVRSWCPGVRCRAGWEEYTGARSWEI